MLGMPTTPHLLLVVLAVLAVMMLGRVDGSDNLSCYGGNHRNDYRNGQYDDDFNHPHGYGEFYFLLAAQNVGGGGKCWAPEMNAAFDGNLGCCECGTEGNVLIAEYDADCATTVANINKDAKYKGPPISCGGYEGVGPLLGWNSEDNCTKGVTALMEVLEQCNGKSDPPSCQTEYAGKCHASDIGTAVRETCPVMCGTCNMCNQGCIPKGVKRKDGQADCCTEGAKTLKCPGPAHYHCGAHALRSNQTTATATANAPPAEQ